MTVLGALYECVAAQTNTWIHGVLPYPSSED